MIHCVQGPKDLTDAPPSMPQHVYGAYKVEDVSDEASNVTLMAEDSFRRRGDAYSASSGTELGTGTVWKRWKKAKFISSYHGGISQLPRISDK